MQCTWNEQKSPKCDVHTCQTKPNAKFLFLWLQFLGGVCAFTPHAATIYPYF